jgi:hypothetical protein
MVQNLAEAMAISRVITMEGESVQSLAIGWDEKTAVLRAEMLVYWREQRTEIRFVESTILLP